MLALAIVFVVTIVLGVPVAFCLGLAGVVFILLSADLPFNILPTIMFGGIDSFPLMAIPFFIMAGDLMSRCGVLPKLIDFANSIVGHLRGGLAYVNVLASMFFAGVTGVAVADTAAIGSMLVPSMIKEGYSRSFSAVVTAASSVMGPIIPPSVAMLIFAYVYGGGISVGKLFLAGAVPGVLIGFGMMGLVFLMARRRGFPISTSGFSFWSMLSRLRGAMLGLMVPVIILGGILGGVFTPTEAGAVAVAYALFIGAFVLRTLGIRDMAASLLSSAKISAVVFLLLATAKIVSWILIMNQVPQRVGEVIFSFTSSPQVFLIILILFLFMLGFVLEAVATMIMMIPVLAPIAVAFGVEPHHLGLLIVMTVQVALITPPVALGLFIVTPMAGCSVEDAVPEIWPFIILILSVVFLVALWPDVAMWLPRYFGY